MAFPSDLSDVAVFKIHPAIGCARLANNDDFYEFFDFEEKRNANQPREYKSVRGGKHWIKRQAVRFRLFAYKTDGTELGELTQSVMTALGIGVTWTASVANRKLNTWNSATPVVEAQASASGNETKRLEGANPWRATKVWLGDITGTGVFIPPKGGVYRKTSTTVIPPWGAHRLDNGVLDTTSDGPISAALTGVGAIPVVPACVIVTPQDHSPDVDPGDFNVGTNLDFVKETRALLGIPQGAVLGGSGYAMDLAMMRTINGEYSPGMEICLETSIDPATINLALPDPRVAFFPRGQQHIHANEIRPAYGLGRARLGALTGGLCSTWQTDLTACLDYWTSTYPEFVEYDAAPTSRYLSRKQFATSGPLEKNAEWLNENMGMMDSARDLNDNIDVLFGTERDGGDNAGADPVGPFPLDPT